MKNSGGLIIFLMAELVLAAWFINRVSGAHSSPPVAAESISRPMNPPVEPMHALTQDEREEFDRLQKEVDQIQRAAEKEIEEKNMRMIELLVGAGSAKK